MRQKSFFNSDSTFSKSRLAYGGDTKGRSKVFRPLDRKRPLHIVMKSSHAKGKLSLLAKKLKVQKLIEEKAAKYRITIHGLQNMGNHLHFNAVRLAAFSSEPCFYVYTHDHGA